jgi:hypothetical protein
MPSIRILFVQAMPAPQSMMMKQAARLKFSSFNLMVPDKWKAPSGDPGARHYADAFKPGEKSTSPDPTAPPLFKPHSLNKYHTDVQKKMTNIVGSYMDGIIDAICQAWSTWQSAAILTGVVIAGPVASVGQVVGLPWTPIILASGPKKSPAEMKYTNTIANVIGTAWLSYTATIKVPGLPWYPAFAACPTPVAPPMPNIPMPVAVLTQVTMPVSANTLKTQMIGMHGDPQAQYHKQIFEAVADAFEKMFTAWQLSTMVTNVLGTGTGGTPISPLPVVGVGNMIPGGFT